jgi:starch synthase
MDKKKVLIVTQEMQPYTALSEISEIARKLPQYVQENGMEIRVLMPRFGTINERRHRLHEVVRLSGMNIIVDDDDFPLIIKVASLPGARMQVYFLDNEDFFKRKSVFENDKGKPFDDNADRMIFFCKGVIETVKKFGWAPDIVHCHGWMTSLVPLYLKTAYDKEPIFQHSKIIYSMYEKSLGKTFSDEFIAKASINNLDPEHLENYKNGNGMALHGVALNYSDAVIIGSPDLSEVNEKLLADLKKPVLEFLSEEEYLPAYLEFYNSLLEQEVE